MSVVEGGAQPNMRGLEHAVSENVALHIADSHHREIRRLGVYPQFAEMTLDRFPCAAGRDSHFLVVIAHRAAGGRTRSTGSAPGTGATAGARSRHSRAPRAGAEGPRGDRNGPTGSRARAANGAGAHVAPRADADAGA